ncbi:MAG TPA: flagellar hook-length control protein FliK [Chthonomonadales bacterium]|nr:flagellar hook-length control protein FliK [Chthonomonadales bacterium]
MDNRGEHAANLSPPDDGVESPGTPVGRVPTTGHVPPRAGESSAVYPSPDLATRSVVLSDADATTDGTRSDGVAALAGRLQALREKAEPLRQGALPEAAATQPARPDRALLVTMDPMVASGSAALRDLILRAAVVRAAAEQLPMQAALGPPAAHVSTEAPADAEAPPAPGAASSQGSAATQTASGQTSTATLRPSDVATRLDTTASAAPEPPPPARPPSTAERAAVVQQVLARIEALNLLRGPQGFSIQLYPEHLGEIRVRVVAEADRVAARIVAETAAAKVAIEADRDLLRSSLEQRGFTLTGLDVALHQGERDAHLPTEGPARWASLARPRDAAPSAVPSASGPSVPAGRPVREDGRIDYRA